MLINGVSLPQLEALLWISRLGTFRAAADRLNTTQPAISNRMRDLEKCLKAKLFERHGRHAALTPVGRRIVRDLEPLLSDMGDRLQQIVGNGGYQGIARIGAGEIVAATCLPGFCAGLGEDMPDVALEISIRLSADLLEDLISAKADLSFMAGPLTHPGILSAEIGAAKLVWVASPKQAQFCASGRTRVWSLSKGSPIHQIMLGQLGTLDLPGPDISICSNVRLLIEILRNGLGIGLAPAPMVETEIAEGRLVRLRQEIPAPQVPFLVAIRKGERDPLTNELYERAQLLTID